MAYRKHSTSKWARKQHTKRVKKRKKKYDGLAAFAYDSMIGKKENRRGKLK